MRLRIKVVFWVVTANVALLMACGAAVDSGRKAVLTDGGDESATDANRHSDVFCTVDGPTTGPAEPPRVVECAAGFRCGEYHQNFWRCCVVPSGRLGCNMAATWDFEDAGVRSTY